MRLAYPKNWWTPGALASFLAALPAIVVVSACAVPSYGQRVYGIDTSSSANASAPSQTAWNNAYNDPDHGGAGYKFAFVRSSRGGTVDLRVDDAHFYDNITRATNAGLLTGSYHFARPDSAAHTAADDANHYLERAGMYMKPGFLLPVFDLEDGNTEHSAASLTAWGMEFMNTLFNSKGVYPIVYTSSSYNNDEVLAELAWTNFGSTPKTSPRTYQWLTRPAGNIETDEPPAATVYPNPYGVWDPNFVTRTNSRDPAINPWVFWQQQFTTTDPHSGITVDYNAANGNIEFVKDFLVPALWTNAGSGDWGTVANWNSDNPTYNGTIQSGPAPRLPGYDDTNANFSLRKFDWVKLQNAGDGTVTISSGAQAARKLYTQQALNINGGSLTINYIPGSGGKFDVASEFNAIVTLAGSATYSAHTTQVDNNGGQFNINGGTVNFRSIDLASHASSPGRIVMGGDATFTPSTLGGTGTAVIRSTGSLAQSGSVDLGAANRTFSITNGTPALDLSIEVPVTGSGGLVKSGAGTMRLVSTNTYAGGTTLSSGTLLIAKDSNLGTAPLSFQSSNIVLNGGTLKTGSEVTSLSLTNVGSGYTNIPTASFTGAGADGIAPVAIVNGKLTSIQVASGGSNYINQSPVSPPAANTAGTFVDIIGGGGTGATAYATVSGGSVTSITVVNQGSGYTSAPTIHISSTISGGSLAGSGATAAVNGMTLTGITLTGSGFDYASPSVTLSGGGGTGATASAVASTNLTLNSNRGVSLTSLGGTLHQTAGTTLTIGGVISSTGSGTLTKSGPGTLVLGNGNTYSGNTVVNDGVLRISASERLPDATAVSVNSPGALDINNLTETIGSLTGNGSVTNIGLLVTGGNDSSTTFSGTIGGSALRKIGVGKMTLTGSSSYSGGTTIAGGTLSASSLPNQSVNSPFGTGNFSIGNGATLEYTGSSASTNRTISLDTGGGAVSVPVGSLTINGVIDGTALTKSGSGTLTLRGVNTYTGNTIVTDGLLQVATASARLGSGDVTVQGATLDTSLRIQTGVTNAIDDSATLNLLGGGNVGVADQGYILLGTGINETIGALFLNGFAQANGITYGGTLSSAIVQFDEYFDGEGVLSVGVPGDFNHDNSVDAADYVTWRANPSTFGGTPGYEMWRANIGNTGPGAGSGASFGGSTAVPEPASVLLAIGAISWIGAIVRISSAKVSISWTVAVSDLSTEALDAKGSLRRAAYDARNAQPEKDRVSEMAIAALMQLPEYQVSRTILWYLDCRSELRTRSALPAALASGKRIIVPYCTTDDRGQNKLGLWWLQALDELVIGKWKILEPPRERWNETERDVAPKEIDFVVVPGVAFGRDGARMGNGQGYYDRLLGSVRPNCPLVGLCYECQLFDNLIVDAHDVFMDKVVTEHAVYEGRRRRSNG